MLGTSINLPRLFKAAVHIAFRNWMDVRWPHGIFQSLSVVEPAEAEKPILGINPEAVQMVQESERPYRHPKKTGS
jgi:hypothetical protein